MLLCKYFNVEDVKKEIKKINSKKATPKGAISVKILKWDSDIIVPVLTGCFNQNIKNSPFPDELKNANISPVYKKKNTVMISQIIDQLVSKYQG